MKNLKSFAVIIAIMLGGGMILSFTTPKQSATTHVNQNEQLDFTLVNKTGYDIKGVYIAPSSSKDWGDDVLKGKLFKNNASVDIVFNPKAKSKLWDIYVGWEGYDSSEDVYWTKFDLSTINKITLKYDAKTNETSADTE